MPNAAKSSKTRKPTKTISDAARQRARRERLRKAGLIEFRFMVPQHLVAGDPDAFRARVQKMLGRMKPAAS